MPRVYVAVDLETTGLGSGTGTLPFLVGVGTWEANEFVTRQLLLPEQSDEAGYLDALESLIPPDAVLVSYNGRTFDWPLLVTRYRLHGRKPPTFSDHLDLVGAEHRVDRTDQASKLSAEPALNHSTWASL